MHLSNRVKLILKVVITLTVLAYLLVSINVDVIVSILASMDPIPLILSLPFICLMYIIRAEKWRILLKSIGANLPFLNALKIFLIGTFYGSVTPGRTGELSRSFYLADRKTRTIPTIIIDRITDIICLLALSVMTILAFFSNQELIIITLALILGFGVCFIILLNKNTVSIFFKLFGASVEHADEYLGTMDTILKDRRALLSAFVLTLVFYLINILVFWLILQSINSTINPVIALSLPIIIIMGNVPISISGLGIREFVSVTIFSLFHQSAAYGFSASLILYLLTYLLPGLAGSILVFGGARPYGAD